MLPTLILPQLKNNLIAAINPDSLPYELEVAIDYLQSGETLKWQAKNISLNTALLIQIQKP